MAAERKAKDEALAAKDKAKDEALAAERKAKDEALAMERKANDDALAAERKAKDEAKDKVHALEMERQSTMPKLERLRVRFVFGALSGRHFNLSNFDRFYILLLLFLFQIHLVKRRACCKRRAHFKE